MKISGNELMPIDGSDIFHCYVDLWKSPFERINMAYQGIGKANMLKHRVGTGNASTDAEDQACWHLQEQVQGRSDFRLNDGTILNLT